MLINCCLYRFRDGAFMLIARWLGYYWRDYRGTDQENLSTPAFSMV
jgi:hypothetical protein